MGLLDFLFGVAVANSAMNHHNKTNRHQSGSYNDNYERGYEDGYDDCCYDHDCSDSAEYDDYSCDHDHDDYSCHDDYDCGCDDCGDW